MEILGILFLATFIEGLITYTVGEKKSTRPYLKYIALALGVAAAILYKVNLLALLDLGLTATNPYVDFVVTGLVIGRGSNYVNDIITLVRSYAKKA